MEREISEQRQVLVVVHGDAWGSHLSSASRPLCPVPTAPPGALHYCSCKSLLRCAEGIKLLTVSVAVLMCVRASVLFYAFWLLLEIGNVPIFLSSGNSAPPV